MTSSAIPASPSLATSARPALTRYRQWVAGIAVAVFYSNVALFLAVTGVSPIPPAALVGLIAVMALPITLPLDLVWRTVATPLGFWAMATAVLAIAGFLHSSYSPVAIEALGGIVGGMIFLFLMVFLLSDIDAHRTARRVLLVCTVTSVGLNAFDVLHPLTFSPIIGRAAGLYFNPNISAFALVFGLAMTVGDVSPRLRAPYVLLIGGGVGLTMSRAGVLMWGLLVVILLLQGQVRLSRLAAATAAAAGLAIGAIVIGGYQDLVRSAAVGVGQLLLERFGPNAAQTDFSTQTRYSVAVAALHMLGEHPILGGGLAATTEWALPEPSHNMYLRLTAELGLLGALIYPAMGLSAASRAGRSAAWRFVPLWLGAGLFSHNLLEERPELVILALMGAATVIHRMPGVSLGDTWQRGPSARSTSPSAGASPPPSGA